MSRINKVRLMLFAGGVFLTASFSNCAKIHVSDIPAASTAQAANTGNTTNPANAGNQPVAALSGRQVSTSTDLRLSGGQLDIVLIMDDSGSMKDDGNQLAGRLGDFVTSLKNSGVDWQMCWIDTDLGRDGKPNNWVFTNSKTKPTDPTVVNSATDNFSRVFTDTVSAIAFGSGSGDERGVATLRRFTERFNTHNCLRPGAALTSIVISDEDERSAGGNPALSQYKPIEDVDIPEKMLLSMANNAKIGRFIANSIVVSSNDVACLTKQSAHETAKYGTFYEHLSSLTMGGIGSICDANYATHLNIFADKITAGLRGAQLICEPVDGSLQVTVNQPATSYTYKVEKGAVVFQLLTDNVYHVDLSYTCK